MHIANIYNFKKAYLIDIIAISVVSPVATVK
jgi:hypothetical protein